MPREPTSLLGPSRLSKILASLNAEPRLELANLRSLKLTLASRNDHFGARHFLKEELPRIRWANPDLPIEVEKCRKTITETWKPELELHFENGRKSTLNLQDKWSTSIVRELMDTAGAPSWFQWKKEAQATGRALLPGAKEPITPPRTSSSSLPSLHQFREMQARAAPSSEASRDPSAKKSDDLASVDLSSSTLKASVEAGLP